MNKLPPGILVAVPVALLVLAAAAYFAFFHETAAPPPAAGPAPATTVAESPAAAPSAPEAIRHPIDAASAPAQDEAPPLPPLDEAGSLVGDALAALLGRPAVLQWLQVDGFVRRVVATVDNLPNRHASPRLWPLHPVAGRFTSREQDGVLQVDPANDARYRPLVGFVEGIDPAAAAALYRRLYPLFQQAYRELGYPQGYFNDRLVEVIDHLQATPRVDGPLAVTLTEVKGPYASAAPWLHHAFADPALQSLSAGQRALLRAGPDNRRRLLAWLSAFRAQIAR